MTTQLPHPFDIEYPAEYRDHGGGRYQHDQWLFTFTNGYTASVIQGKYSYGGEEGLYELAVLVDGLLCYGTPVTSDVEGGLTRTEASYLIRQVAELPIPLNGCYPMDNPRG